MTSSKYFAKKPEKATARKRSEVAAAEAKANNRHQGYKKVLADRILKNRMLPERPLCNG